MRRSIASLLAACSLAACSAQTPPIVEGQLADEVPWQDCAFGSELSEWDDPAAHELDFEFYEHWSTVYPGQQLWDGALEQMVEALGFDPGGESDEERFAAVLAETDDSEFDYREIVNPRTGEGYLAWRYYQGDDRFGAIFPMDSAEPVARIVQNSVESCTIAKNVIIDSCGDTKTNGPESASLLATTGALVEVDGAFRAGSATFAAAGDVDWFEVRFATESQCYSCFRPHAWVEDEDLEVSSIGEMCVFIETAEAAKRGAGECAAGDPVEVDGFTGCCSTDLSRGVWLELPWDHTAKDSSSMYLRMTANSEVNECTAYEFTYGHFGG